MTWGTVITLRGTTFSDDLMGTPTTINTDTEIFANEKSVRQSEFYQAMAQGLRPEKAFEIRVVDYNRQSIVIVDGIEYSIIRTYKVNPDVMEIVCQGSVIDGGAI